VSAADLALASESTAVIAYNDIMALGAINRLNSRGVRVPDEMSVVGIDGSLMGEISSPALTSVVLPQERAGRACVRLLIEHISAGERAGQVQHVVMPTQLLVRGSTTVPRI
jgi:LacI family transcriptional regulator